MELVMFFCPFTGQTFVTPHFQGMCNKSGPPVPLEVFKANGSFPMKHRNPTFFRGGRLGIVVIPRVL